MGITILFASETGNSQDAAWTIFQNAKRRQLPVSCMSIDAYPNEQFVKENCVIFTCSTTGDGDIPLPMTNFWNALLRKNLPTNLLSHMQYAVFGLGDSSYQKFNFAGKKLYKRLSQLGAKSMTRRGDGDQQHRMGYDGALLPWLDELWPSLYKALFISIPPQAIPSSVLLPPTYHVQFKDSVDVNDINDQVPDGNCFQLTENKRITSSDHFQDVRHFEFSSDNKIEYSCGDVLVLKPKNSEQNVNDILEYLGWSDLADKTISITPSEPTTSLPASYSGSTSLRWLFLHHFDITQTPRRSFFELLSFFATSEVEKNRLLEFASTEGQDDLYEYALRPRRTIMETLHDFNSLKISLHYIFDLFPSIRPRSFSISSHPNSPCISITVAIVKYKTILQKPRLGLCTNWLKNLKIGDIVYGRIQKGTMKLPNDISTPALFISAGTGIAPMKSFLEDRICLGTTFSDTLFFFGCRNKQGDFLYSEELNKAVAEGSVSLFTSFSRDQDRKVYIQHIIEEQGQLVWNTIGNRAGYIYLSGNASRLPTAIDNVLSRILQQYGKFSKEESEKYLILMKKNHRYQVECWS